jgi:hypothetical protein
MTKRSGHSLPPPARRGSTPLPVRRGPLRQYDPFYVFERIARDNGSAPKSPEPKRQQQLLALLEGKAALVIMICLLLFVVAGLLAVVIVRL